MIALPYAELQAAKHAPIEVVLAVEMRINLVVGRFGGGDDRVSVHQVAAVHQVAQIDAVDRPVRCAAAVELIGNPSVIDAEHRPRLPVGNAAAFGIPGATLEYEIVRDPPIKINVVKLAGGLRAVADIVVILKRLRIARGWCQDGGSGDDVADHGVIGNSAATGYHTGWQSEGAAVVVVCAQGRGERAHVDFKVRHRPSLEADVAAFALSFADE